MANRLLILSSVVLLAASVASADIVVGGTGPIYEARITYPVVVGSHGGQDLIAFDLIFENVSGDPGADPFNLDITAQGALHQHSFAAMTMTSPTLTSPMADDLDTHFNTHMGGLMYTVMPTEDANAAPSDMVVEFPAYGGLPEGVETYSFGTFLRGSFDDVGNRPAGPLRATEWNVAHFVVPSNFASGGPDGLRIYGEIGGLTVSENYEINFFPEPVTMSLLAIGGVALLKRRRK